MVVLQDGGQRNCGVDSRHDGYMKTRYKASAEVVVGVEGISEGHLRHQECVCMEVQDLIATVERCGVPSGW